MIHTNRCKHCNKTKEEHWSSNYSCADNIYPTTDDRVFIDSGLAALDAHKEELFLAVDEYFELNGTDRRLRVIAILDKIKKEANQIEKEK